MPSNFNRQDNKTLFNSEEEMQRRGLEESELKYTDNINDTEQNERVVYVTTQPRKTVSEWTKERKEGFKERASDTLNSGQPGSILDIVRIIFETSVDLVKGAITAIQTSINRRNNKNQDDEE